MHGLGTLINVCAVLVGGVLGLLIGARLPERIRETMMHAIGLLVIVLGVSMGLKTGNFLIVLGALVLGGVTGELLGIEDRIERLGRWIELRTARNGNAAGQPGDPAQSASSRFARAFLATSILFCVGPIAILGSIQDGLSGDYSLLAVKSMLDGISSLALASTLGPGVVLAAGPLLVYQGALTAAAGWADRLLTDPMVAEMTATGGVMMVGIGIGLLGIKRFRIGNLLPALALAPLIVAIIASFSG
jgi:uncharacterized protein